MDNVYFVLSFRGSFLVDYRGPMVFVTQDTLDR